MDTILDFIAKKRVERLKKAFMGSPTIVRNIQNMWNAYDKMQKDLDEYCKKYPDACREGEKMRNQYKR